MHYVYFLELSNGNIYVGFSSNLKQQIKGHNDSKVPATAGFLPAIVILGQRLIDA